MPKVLVIRGGAIGDFILTLPAIKLLRDSIPGASIEVLGYQPITELAVAAGLAESTRHLEHVSMAKLFVPGVVLDESLMDYFRSFNVVVSYLYDPDGYFRGNMERIGVKTFLEASHRVEPGMGHATEQLARPLERIAMWLEDPSPNLGLEKSAEVPSDRPVIAVHPGSGSLKKCLPLAHWAKFGGAFKEILPSHRLALITGEAELERGITAAVAEAWRGVDHLHWDHLPLTELATRLTACAGFIGHDSGISHLAAACGVPCHLFFGPTDPGTWAPRHPRVTLYVEESGDLSAVPFDSLLRAVLRFVRTLG
jgi:ADP-heptose:LPS heptosyltransferase